MSKPPSVVRTLSADTIAELEAKIEATTFCRVYRACRVTESTLRRALLGRALSESSHRLITAYARNAQMKGGNHFETPDPS